MSAHIYIDADACPVREETYKVARRHKLPVTVVANTYLRTPREPGILNDASQAELHWYIQRFGRYIEARERRGDTLVKFKEEYPDWYKPAPNRYATHFFMNNNSRMYRILRGEDLRSDQIRRDLMTVQNASEAAQQRWGSQR